jgi:large subunit ribosomal protein L25
MSDISLKAIKRENIRNSENTKLRRSGMIPGIYYGIEAGNIPIAANELALRPLVYTSESHIVNLNIDGEQSPLNCILKDVQFDPVTDKVIHFDLLAVSEFKVISVEVPVSLKGQPIGVKEGGHLQHGMHRLEIECLPKNIPAHIDIDITNLNIGDSVSVGDLKMEGIKFLNDASSSIVSITAPIAEVAAETPAEVTAEPEVITKSKKEDE